MFLEFLSISKKEIGFQDHVMTNHRNITVEVEHMRLGYTLSGEQCINVQCTFSYACVGLDAILLQIPFQLYDSDMTVTPF